MTSRPSWCPAMYDPIPDLAALVDGAAALLSQGRGVLLADVMLRLRAGLLLDDPGRGDITTEAAIREALGQPAMPQAPDSAFAYIDPHPGEIARHRDLPVISAATAVMSNMKLMNYYTWIWPESRVQEVRRRLLKLAGNLPESEREKMPAWLLREIHSDLREKPGD